MTKRWKEKKKERYDEIINISFFRIETIGIIISASEKTIMFETNQSVR